MKIRWDSKYKNIFRAGLIGNLSAFNLLTSDINISSKESINKVLTDFTNIVRSVPDPLFFYICKPEREKYILMTLRTQVLLSGLIWNVRKRKKDI